MYIIGVTFWEEKFLCLCSSWKMLIFLILVLVTCCVFSYQLTDCDCLLQATYWNKAHWLKVLPKCLKGQSVRILYHKISALYSSAKMFLNDIVPLALHQSLDIFVPIDTLPIQVLHAAMFMSIVSSLFCALNGQLAGKEY